MLEHVFDLGNGVSIKLQISGGDFGVSMPLAPLANLVFAAIEAKSPPGIVIIEKEIQAAALAVLAKS